MCMSIDTCVSHRKNIFNYKIKCLESYVSLPPVPPAMPIISGLLLDDSAVAAMILSFSLSPITRPLMIPIQDELCSNFPYGEQELEK